MSFISYTYRYDADAQICLATLVDSEFGEIEVAEDIIGKGNLPLGAARTIYTMREYIKRNLDVGRNLALFALYRHRHGKISVERMKALQDEWCPAYIENWKTYAEERDYHLRKLLALL